MQLLGRDDPFLSGISLLVFVYFDVLEEGFIHLISFGYKMTLSFLFAQTWKYVTFLVAEVLNIQGCLHNTGKLKDLRHVLKKNGILIAVL